MKKFEPLLLFFLLKQKLQTKFCPERENCWNTFSLPFQKQHKQNYKSIWLFRLVCMAFKYWTSACHGEVSNNTFCHCVRIPPLLAVPRSTAQFILKSKKALRIDYRSAQCAHVSRLLRVVVLTTSLAVLRSKNVATSAAAENVYGFFITRRKIPKRMVSVWCQKAACVIIFMENTSFPLSRCGASRFLHRRSDAWGIYFSPTRVFTFVAWM